MNKRRRRFRWLIALLLLIAALPILQSCVVHELGGASSEKPSEMSTKMSAEARALVARALEGLPAERILDYHTHVVGSGSSGSGITVSPELRSWLHPKQHARYLVFMSACAIDDFDDADRQFLLRLDDVVAHATTAGRHALLAFDKNYHPDGTANEEETELHVPNAYVFELARRNPARYIPVMSVHPCRADAIAELEKWAAAGGRMVKWLPNAMGIDPDAPVCDPFYDRMRDLGLILLSHAGHETAVDSAGAQRFGNPLKLRRALDHGVKVIIAHCATDGSNPDLDDPEQKEIENFELFLRLMGEGKYEGLLFGELSGITVLSRPTRYIETLLARADLHGRLVNGSDYPIPAVNCIVWLSRFAKAGLISSEEVDLLQEIYEYNPILFDLVLKRCYRHPKTGQRFPAQAFLEHPELKL